MAYNHSLVQRVEIIEVMNNGVYTGQNQGFSAFQTPSKVGSFSVILRVLKFKRSSWFCVALKIYRPFPMNFGSHNSDYSFRRKVCELVLNGIWCCTTVIIRSVKDFKFEIRLVEQLVLAEVLLSKGAHTHTHTHICMYVCISVFERERERERLFEVSFVVVVRLDS